MPLFDEVKRAGLADMATLAQLDPELQPLMMPSLMEELGWGDAGLAMLSLARDFAKIAAYAKVHSTETAYELAQEAMRLFGGNGLTLEYPIEKLLRDCQRSLIEDGENNVLGLNAVSMLSQPHHHNAANRPMAGSARWAQLQPQGDVK